METDTTHELVASYDIWLTELEEIVQAAELVLPKAARATDALLRTGTADFLLAVAHVRWLHDALRAQLLDDVTYLLGSHSIVATTGITVPPPQPEPPLPSLPAGTVAAALADGLLAWVGRLRWWHDVMSDEDHGLAVGLVSCLSAGEAMIDDMFHRLAAVARQSARTGGAGRWWRAS